MNFFSTISHDNSCSQNSNVNEWNNKTAEITGYSKNFALGKPLVQTFIMPELQKSVQYVLDQALHGNETSNYELEFCSASAEIRYLLGTTNQQNKLNFALRDILTLLIILILKQ